LLQHGHRIVGVGSFHNAESGLAQSIGGDEADQRFVINNQHASFVGRAHFLIAGDVLMFLELKA
jgi:hypothetical protein